MCEILVLMHSTTQPKRCNGQHAVCPATSPCWGASKDGSIIARDIVKNGGSRGLMDRASDFSVRISGPEGIVCGGVNNEHSLHLQYHD